MITDGKLSAILSYLTDDDRIPDENGEYTISYTTYGCSSLSVGGSYFDKANHFGLLSMLQGAEGIRERSSWPGVYSLVFNPEKMRDEDADRLLQELSAMHEHDIGYPCIDEDMASRFEFEDKEEAVRDELDDLKENGNELLDNLKIDINLIDKVLRAMDETGDVLIVEPGPSIYLDTEKFLERLPSVSTILKKRT